METRLFVGRMRELKDLHSVIKTNSGDNVACVSGGGNPLPAPAAHKSGKKIHTPKRALIWFCGRQGVGKTALLAEYVKTRTQELTAEDERRRLLYHNCTASPNSGDREVLLRRLLQFLGDDSADVKEIKCDIEASDFKKRFNALGKNFQAHQVIIIDQIDKVDECVQARVRHVYR
jgi:hypothetical protein